MNQYKKKLLEMLNYLNEICEKHSLNYYAVGGTLLGAVRHKGFIPWDDDIDVCMPRNDYDRFAEIVNSDNRNYIVETPYSKAKDYCYSVSKLYDTSTTLVEGIKYQTKRGLYIDIFPLDGIGNTLNEVNKNYRKIDILNAIFSARTSVVRDGRAKWKNMLIRIADAIPNWMLNDKKLLLKLDRICRRYSFEDSDFVGVLLTQYRKKYIMPKKLFMERQKYQFENTYIIGVKNYNMFLNL